MAEQVFGFQNRQVAQRLKDFAGELADQARIDNSSPVPRRGIGQHRTYWIVPKGTIPAATSDTVPGVGIGYVCFLNRELVTPEIERFKVDATDTEVEVFNHTVRELVEVGEVEPLIRVSEDVFGELAIVDGDTHFLFTLLADLDGGAAAASLTLMIGGSTFAATVLDPLDMFDALETGARGICISQAGKYYVIQAECPEDAEVL